MTTAAQPGMDRPRTTRARGGRRSAAVGLGLGLVALVAFAWTRVGPVAPRIDRNAVWLDEVQRGEMVRQVRAPGVLVPEEVRWISVSHEGRVERILHRPGSFVEPGTVLVELSNAELDLQALEARSAHRAEKSDLANLVAVLESQLISQRVALAGVASELKQAELQLEANRRLANDGLLPQLTLRLSKVRTEELDSRHALEQQHLDGLARSIEAQLAAQRSRLERARALDEFRRAQLGALTVRAGTDGVVQEVPLEIGQTVSPGANLALVSDPARLIAQLRVSETQARDVRVGMSAAIDTRNGVIPGSVTRIDPAVREATVTVDVALRGALPCGARPEMNVDGLIEIERLDDVLHVGRPAFGREAGAASVFRLTDGGRAALRVPVRFGRRSVTEIEIVDGLTEGDKIILSDTSAWDDADRLVLQ